MQYCSKCKIHIRGNKACCPLCLGSLTGEPAFSAFPALPEKKVSRVSLFKVAAFITVLLVIAMSMVSFFTDFKYLWPQVVSICALVALADLAVALYFRSNPMRMTQTQVYFGMIVLLAIDFFTGRHGWSIVWALPVGFIMMMAVIMMMGRSLRTNLADYIIYPFVNTLLSLLQLIPINSGMNPFPYPAVISIGGLLAFCAFLFIFRFRELKGAVIRYLHV